MQPAPSSFSAIDSSVQTAGPEIVSKKKKQKKRSREDDQAANPPVEGGKKKKHKHCSDDNVEPISVSKETPMAAPNNADHVEPGAPLKAGKKKKAKAKEIEKVTSPTEQTDAEIEATSQASAAALLSAIVATMSNSQTSPSSAPSQMQQPLSFNPQLPGQQFPPLLPMQIDFPQDFQNGGAHPNVFAHPQVVPGQNYARPNGISLSDLSFGSNEDILRALQDLDVSKIASTLKNLGDAAAGPGPPALPSQMLFAPTAPAEPHPPPVPGQVSAVPLNRVTVPKKTVSSTGQKRTIDMNLPGNQQHANSAHAHLLANKWLNASKLTELVREQGIVILLQINHISITRITGLVYKKGKFSAIEEQQLKSAIELYQQVMLVIVV